MRNGEHYADPTASAALAKMIAEEKKLTRADYRRLMKEQDKVHVMTKSEEQYWRGYETGKAQAAQLQVGNTIRIYTTAVMCFLIDEMGFGRKRVERAMSHLYATFLDLHDDMSREPKLRAYVKIRTGLDPDDWTGARKIDIAQEVEKTVAARLITREEARNGKAAGPKV